MVEVAGFISSHPHTVRETGGAKGKTAEAKGSPESIYAGTQQNMLRTVTSVSGALSEYIEDIRV